MKKARKGIGIKATWAVWSALKKHRMLS